LNTWSDWQKKGLALDLRSKGLVFFVFFYSMGGIQLSAMHERSHFSSVFCLSELTILQKIKDKRRTFKKISRLGHSFPGTPGPGLILSVFWESDCCQVGGLMCCGCHEFTTLTLYL
jgi:hypothetical protein